MARWFAVTAIVTSAFHFWPLDHHRIWELVCLPNALVLLATVGLGLGLSLTQGRWPDRGVFPPACVWAYLAVQCLSLTFSPDLGRSVSYFFKELLMFLGGYVLFGLAIQRNEHLITIYRAALVALAISVGAACTGQFCGVRTLEAGFFGSTFKYGTYVGIMTPLCGTYLLLSPKMISIAAGSLVTLGALISCQTLGGLGAIVGGLLAAAALAPGRLAKLRIGIPLILVSGTFALIGSQPSLAPFRADTLFSERNGTDLRQRYIEWQAELNLLERRMLTGTGAGCINTYRSEFYYRLPKLNTLKPYDQNGWLATTAEAGLLGLVCLCWIYGHFLQHGRSQIEDPWIQNPKHRDDRRRWAIANVAGLVGAGVANLFSSVCYNGLLIAFVLVLALIARTEHLMREAHDGNA